MKAEYLLFDLVMIAAPVVLSCIRGPTFFVHRWARAAVAIVVGAAPWVLWDVLVAERHWWFAEDYTLGPSVLGLPLEEWGFFVAVPFACLYTWEILVRGPQGQPHPLLRWAWVAVAALLPLGVWVFLATGREYTGLSLACMGAAASVDVGLRTHLLRRPRTWAYLAVVSLFTVVFNNFLTGRPIVLYDASYQLDWRVVTMPIEDLGFGLGLMITVTAIYAWLGEQVRRDPSFGVVGRLIRARLGGYRRTVVVPEPDRPVQHEGPPIRVAVIGGGIAGLTAATTLSERGLSVTLLEKNPYLGGKLGGWTFESDGETLRADHGFHAFFRQYYNLNDFLRRTGIAGGLVPIDDYRILTRGGDGYSFTDLSRVPGLNLLSQWRIGVYDFLPIALGPAGPKLEQMLRFDPQTTFAELDDTSFADFADQAKLPDDLRKMFTTFARAFFADARRMSMAELIKSFHFYYLSNDAGLIYDYLDDDYALSVEAPLREVLRRQGAEIRVGAPVQRLARTADGGIEVDGEPFDWVVLAADVPGSRGILKRSGELLAESPALASQVQDLSAGQRYAVLRLWFDRPIEADMPVFVITERDRTLDSITFVHRITRDAAEWAERTGGSVIELHCYAVPDELHDGQVRPALLEELSHYVPEATADHIVHEHLQLRADFPAFHVGRYRSRPEVDSGVDRLLLAGDWVKLPVPSMLMEAACTSGLYASNVVLDAHGLQRVRIDAVPEKGLLVGVPSPPPPPWAS
jgi:isorenieratene synthase